jgi:hypothetical protein
MPASSRLLATKTVAVNLPPVVYFVCFRSSNQTKIREVAMGKRFYPLLVFLLAGSLFGADPFVGTWKLNIAKSKLAGPLPLPKELTLTIEVAGGQATVTTKGTTVDGSPISAKDTFPRTGGPVQHLEGGPPPGISSTFAKTKADSGTADLTDTKDGKVIQTTHVVVSADGKSFRLIVKGTDPQGKKYESVEAWDKQ